MGGSIRVLHVDDDPAFADLVADSLERENDRFDVETATSAREGLDRLAGADVDCIVSDYDVPGMDGIEFLEAVREDYPDLPFVLYTGKGSEAVASDAISAGVTDYLKKDRGASQHAVLANRIENAVEQYRARTNYREIFEKVPDGVTLHDPTDGAFLDANREFCEMLGYSREELLDLDFDAIHVGEPPYTAERAERLVRKTARDGSRTFEWIDETKDGEPLPVEVHLRQTVIDGDQRILAVVRDTSDRKERQRELERERDRYTTLFENLPNPVVHGVLDDGTAIIRDANPAFEATFGYDAEAIVGEPLHDLILPDAEAPGADVASLNRRLRTEGALHTEVRRKTADGVRDFRVDVAVPDPDADAPDGYAIYTDITERKEREQRLEAERREFQTLAENLPNGAVALFDTDFRYTVAAGESFDHHDLSTGEFEGKRLDEVHTAEFREQHLPKYRAALDGERSVFEFEYEGRIYQGRTVPVRDSSGEVIAGIAMTQDVTERRRRERELERQNERLEEFASIVSHDLQNPLNVAEGHLELAREERDSEHLDAVADAHDRVRSLIDDLLTLAREGESAGELEPVDLAEAVERCWRTVATAEATLVVDAGRRIRADPARLRQLLENLMGNAVDHGGEDVTVTVGELDDGAGFYVADDGPGVPEAEREAVFEAGYSTTETGTGFGLSIVAEVAEAHGWDVGVTESEDGGARFEVTGVEFA